VPIQEELLAFIEIG